MSLAKDLYYWMQPENDQIGDDLTKQLNRNSQQNQLLGGLQSQLGQSLSSQVNQNQLVTPMGGLGGLLYSQLGNY